MSKRNLRRWAQQQYSDDREYPTWQRWAAGGALLLMALAILRGLGVL
jgi:hypothetical protein